MKNATAKTYANLSMGEVLLQEADKITSHFNQLYFSPSILEAIFSNNKDLRAYYVLLSRFALHNFTPEVEKDILFQLQNYKANAWTAAHAKVVLQDLASFGVSEHYPADKKIRHQRDKLLQKIWQNKRINLYGRSLLYCGFHGFYTEGKINYTAAQEYYAAIAENISFANTELGYLYQEGLGVKRNSQLTFDYYQKGVEAGDPRATFRLAEIYEKNNDILIALEHYKGSARNGMVMALAALGRIYWDYATNPQKNPTVILDKKLNESEAQQLLAVIAKKYYLACHTAGMVVDYELGYLYLRGIDNSPCIKTARGYLIQGLQRGNYKCLWHLKELELTMQNKKMSGYLEKLCNNFAKLEVTPTNTKRLLNILDGNTSEIAADYEIAMLLKDEGIIKKLLQNHKNDMITLFISDKPLKLADDPWLFSWWEKKLAPITNNPNQDTDFAKVLFYAGVACLRQAIRLRQLKKQPPQKPNSSQLIQAEEVCELKPEAIKEAFKYFNAIICTADFTLQEKFFLAQFYANNLAHAEDKNKSCEFIVALCEPLQEKYYLAKRALWVILCDYHGGKYDPKIFNLQQYPYLRSCYIHKQKLQPSVSNNNKDEGGDPRCALRANRGYG